MENNTRVEDSSRHPIKKCHILEGKYFIVLDESIVQKLQFSNVDNSELYFQQEFNQDGFITLRQYRFNRRDNKKIDSSL
jgi:hypothetical protein